MEFLRAERMPVADHFLASTKTTADQLATTAMLTGEVCESCFACFANKAELWMHARDRHADDPRLVCPEPGCGRRFFARAMCLAHRAEHLPHLPSPMTCELCGRPSRSTVALDRHTAAAHPYARQAVCRTCRTYHGDKMSLIAHLQLWHGGDNDSHNGRKRSAPDANAAESSYRVKRESL